MADVLIIHASFDGQTTRIAQRIGVVIAAAGHRVTVRSADEAGAEVDRCDAAIVGGAIRYGRFPVALERFARLHGTPLALRPNAFFCVCLAVRDPAKGVQNAAGYIGKFVDGTGWRPRRTASFAGALPYTRYKLLMRLMMRLISRASGGDTDTSRDYEYTDWMAVERFASDFAESLQPSGQCERAA
jgi:menaquinone-dependent protoporphyrinogen oxidase